MQYSIVGSDPLAITQRKLAQVLTLCRRHEENGDGSRDQEVDSDTKKHPAAGDQLG